MKTKLNFYWLKVESNHNVPKAKATQLEFTAEIDTITIWYKTDLVATSDLFLLDHHAIQKLSNIFGNNFLWERLLWVNDECSICPQSPQAIEDLSENAN